MTATAPDDETRPLTLDRLILLLARESPRAITCARLLELAARLDLDDELVERRSHFTAEAYARNLVCRTPEVEVLVLCWRPGQESTVHDHAGSLNAIRVHRGTLTSRLFAPAAGAAPGCGPVELIEEKPAGAGTLTGLDRGGIHQLANLSGDDVVTIHLYAPPLLAVTAYSTASPQVVRQQLRYTVAEDLDRPSSRKDTP